MIQENQKGFTLVELLVTVGIIGILATITVASLSGTRTRARDAQRLSDVKQIAAALDSEFAANPGGEEAGVVLDGCTAAADASKLTSACSGPGDAIKEVGANGGNIKIKDPGKLPGTPCKTGTPAADNCGYSIESTAQAAPKTGDYVICFKLENANGESWAKGLNSISKSPNSGSLNVKGACTNT